MSYCQPDADGYCPACDPERLRRIPAGAFRGCKLKAPPAIVASRRAACRACGEWSESQACAELHRICGCPGGAKSEYGRRVNAVEGECPLGRWPA